ncbi:MAG: glycerophosphodiester phosphodiesterase [Bacteroidetes bacterium]|nr:glycerophosphodiester phosphodiesterase [Bacteroidota bacterium]
MFMTTSSKKMNEDLPAFDKEGHRGCRGLMPENTIPAMIKAIEIGVTTLEMDALITKDKKVIISHDPFFNHEITTKEDGTYIDAKDEKNYVIYKMDYAETQKFDVGLKPNPQFPAQQKMAVHKPLLSDLIDSVEQFCKAQKKPLPFYNIETKSLATTDNIYHPEPEEFVKLLMDVIVAKKIISRVIIQSFDPRTLQIVDQKYPMVKTSLLIVGYDKRTLDAQLDQLGFTPTIYSPEQNLVVDSLLDKCHMRGMKVIPWTVDDKSRIERLKKMGVDGIITDFPNLF